MKKFTKILSFILSVTMLFCIFPSATPVSALTEKTVTENVENFCDDLNEMVAEYSDLDFVTPDFAEENPATENFVADNAVGFSTYSNVTPEVSGNAELDTHKTWEAQSVENIDEVLDIKYCPRLIVQSNKPIDTYNAVDVVSGFSDFYILQFKNEEDTNYAYGQYKNNADIISVEYDISYNALASITEEETSSTALTYEDYKNGWYLESTGMDKVLEKYQDQNLPEIKVAVLDTGLDLNCEYLKDRIIQTGFNNTGDGDKNSEQATHSHGTMVTSVIANCTTDNVKIANYRIFGDDENVDSIALVCSALLQAVNDGADIINCSFSVFGEYALIEATIDYAWASSCIIIAAAGNWGHSVEIGLGTPLVVSDKVITVGANNLYNLPTYFTNYGKTVDILAPGQDMPLIGLNSNISTVRGTSFSTPFMVGVYAMYYATHQTVPFEERVRRVANCGSGTNEEYVTDLFGSGIVNPLKLFGLDLVEEPKFSLEPGKYVGDISLELYAEDGADIYYTTDQTYPSPTNGFKYTAPITVTDDELCIRAVAYKNGNRSNYNYGVYHAVTLGTDDMFTVNNDGVITEYKGNVKYLKIPEEINGITVKEISWFSGFDKAELYGVILPDTVQYLGWTMDRYDRPLTTDEQVGAFGDNENLDFIVGNGIKIIGYYGVSFNPNLMRVEFPNCEEIMPAGFYGASMLGAEFPKVKKVGAEAFWCVSKLRELYLPECEEIGCYAFEKSSFLKTVYAPKANFMEEQEYFEEIFSPENPASTELMFSACRSLAKVDLPLLETIGTDFFDHSTIKTVELSDVKYIYDLPNTLTEDSNGGTTTFYGGYYRPVPVELSLPSTLQYCVSAEEYKNEYIQYAVYGTKGTYAEQWATDNDIPFYEITQKNAVVEDIEPVWDECSYKPLEFDARGFNRTYQWYGSYDNTVGNDELISGATSKTFNPDENEQYPYYYCVMNSKDIDVTGNIVNEVNITSDMCQNRLYYIYNITGTNIDYNNFRVFTQNYAQTSIDNIIGIQDATTYYYRPSYIYRKVQYYGTGSTFEVLNDNGAWETYTLIVEGDVNGDSVVDVLDATTVGLAANGLTALENEYFIAADTNLNETITVEDYSTVVNLALSS
ncbi:MAG: S8 family serine peptidase [Acutalibacteraceae bacterium]